MEIGYSATNKNIGAILKAHYERILYPLEVFEIEEKKKAQAQKEKIVSGSKKCIMDDRTNDVNFRSVKSVKKFVTLVSNDCLPTHYFSSFRRKKIPTLRLSLASRMRRNTSLTTSRVEWVCEFPPTRIRQAAAQSGMTVPVSSLAAPNLPRTRRTATAATPLPTPLVPPRPRRTTTKATLSARSWRDSSSSVPGPKWQGCRQRRPRKTRPGASNSTLNTTR